MNPRRKPAPEPPDRNGRPMEERVGRLEGHYQALSERMGGLESKTEKILSLLSEHRAKELPPLQTILTTAAIVMALIGSAGTFFFWLVDTRVGSAVSDTNKFVNQMTDRGGIFVKLSDIDHRIDLQQRMIDSLMKKVEAR
jgi:hypothetical protein